MTEHYDVGYCKPPKRTRFRKGQSGNPKGRPKGRKNMRTYINDVLQRTVNITENGQVRRVKFLEAFTHQMAAKALNGSTRDQIALFKAFHDYAPDLLREVEPPMPITVKYVLPDGKTMEDYPDSDRSADVMENDPEASPAKERRGPRSGEDDSWLE